MTQPNLFVRICRRLPIFGLFVWIAIPGATPAAEQDVAGFQSATDLVVKCRGSSPHGQEYCFAYIAATADSVRAYQSWIGSQDICIPVGISQGQLRDIFIAYGVRNPSRLNNQAASIVILSLAEKFPCDPAKHRNNGR